MGLVVVVQDGGGRIPGVVELACEDRPPERHADPQDEQQGNRQKQKQRIHERPQAGWAAPRPLATPSPARRVRRQALAATAREENSMVSAATQGCTQPMAASGAINRCQAREPYRFWRAMRRVALSSDAEPPGPAAPARRRTAWRAAKADGTDMDIAQGQLMTSKATVTATAWPGCTAHQYRPTMMASRICTQTNQKARRSAECSSTASQLSWGWPLTAWRAQVSRKRAVSKKATNMDTESK